MDRLTLERKAAAKIELNKRKIKSDLTYYIEHYCHIENKDIPEQKELFVLWDGQKKALQAFEDFRLNVVLKARQLGLTWLALSYANHEMIFKPGYTVVGLSKKEDDAKELVRRLVFQLQNLPNWLIREHDPKNPFPITYESTTLSVTFYHDGAESSRFIAMPAAKDSGRSFTANLVIIDEWAFQQWAQEIWTAAYPTVNRPTGGKVIGLSTGLRGTLFEQIWQGAESGENTFHATFLPWTTDPRRTLEWYEQTKKDLPRSYRQEYPANPEDAFTAGEGAMFGEFSREIHVKGHWTPPASWKIVGAYDYGYSGPACYKWYALSPDGWARAYREYYPTRVKVSEQAKTIVAMSKRPDGTPEKIYYTVADTQCWTPNGETGETIAETFAKNGVPLRKADKEHYSGWARLHEWLDPFEDENGNMTAMLTFTENCKNTIRTYPSLVVDKDNPEDLADGQEDHPQDVDRYFVMSRPQPTKPEKKLQDTSTEARVRRNIEKYNKPQKRGRMTPL